MEQHGDGLWSISHDFSLGGMAFGTRTAILDSGEGLLVVSPGDLSSEDIAAIRSVGEVSHVIAPNLWHHLFADAARQAFGVPLLAVEGLEAKRKGSLSVDGLVSERSDFGEDVQLVHVQGQPLLRETVFVHVPSRTLVITDLAFNFQDPTPALTRFQMKYVFGSYGRLCSSRLAKYGLTKDKAAMRRSVDAIDELPWDHVLVGHGVHFIPNAREAWGEAMAWV